MPSQGRPANEASARSLPQMAGMSTLPPQPFPFSTTERGPDDRIRPGRRASNFSATQGGQAEPGAQPRAPYRRTVNTGSMGMAVAVVPHASQRGNGQMAVGDGYQQEYNQNGPGGVSASYAL